MLFIFVYRCGIPVVLMGETGCGKTRLIRYMCDLVRQGQDTTNMLILKVWVCVYNIMSFIFLFKINNLIGPWRHNKN